jgi:hypothetical protein
MELVSGICAPISYVYEIELAKLDRICITHQTDKRCAETIRWKPKTGDGALESKA